MFKYFSKFRIYNCILVSQVHYVIDNGYNRPTKENDVETGVQLRVNTWFPYQISQHCIEVDDITLLDSWVISAQGYFTKKDQQQLQRMSYGNCRKDRSLDSYCAV